MLITNPNTQFLYRQAIEKDGLKTSSTGALLAFSGQYCGRCPNSKRITGNKSDINSIWWGDVNRRMSPELFDIYLKYAKNSLTSPKDRTNYHVMGCAGWDTSYQQLVHVYCQEAYQALFMKNMLVEISEDNHLLDTTDFTIYNMGHVNLREIQDTVPENLRDPTLNDTLVAINLTTREMIIYGTRYAGEMKKGLLTWMMYYSQKHDQLCLHSSANKSKTDSDTTLFFGMSGTGKTTLSADPNRILIGDDEHVWTDRGVFNIEGGCYAKCLNLSASHEPEIFNAVRHGSVLENVVTDANGVVDFKDDRITQNTRCSYPLQYIPNSHCTKKGVGGHPDRIIFLTCDVLGVLPAVSKLDIQEAIRFFLSGYTSKMTGTEEGITEPTLTFSACFGEPFLVWHPREYADLLKKKIEQHQVPVWLVNTGWVKNPGHDPDDPDDPDDPSKSDAREFHRIPLKYTRQMIDFIHSYNPHATSETDFIDYSQQCDQLFHFQIPQSQKLVNIPAYILQPHLSWETNEWETKIHYLSSRFQKNWNEKISQ